MSIDIKALHGYLLYQTPSVLCNMTGFRKTCSLHAGLLEILMAVSNEC